MASTTGNVTKFPSANWQAIAAALGARLLAAEARYTTQDAMRIDEIDAAAQQIVDLQQRVTLLDAQNQELIRQQAAAAIAHQAVLATATETQTRFEQQAHAAANDASVIARLRWWRRGLLILVPAAACAALLYPSAFRALLPF